MSMALLEEAPRLAYSLGLRCSKRYFQISYSTKITGIVFSWLEQQLLAQVEVISAVAFKRQKNAKFMQLARYHQHIPKWIPWSKLPGRSAQPRITGLCAKCLQKLSKASARCWRCCLTAASAFQHLECGGQRKTLRQTESNMLAPVA